MKTITLEELKNNVLNLLNEVLETNHPLVICHNCEKLKIIPVKKNSKLDNLISRPDVIIGDPEDLVNISWEKEWEYHS